MIKDVAEHPDDGVRRSKAIEKQDEDDFLSDSIEFRNGVVKETPTFVFDHPLFSDIDNVD